MKQNPIHEVVKELAAQIALVDKHGGRPDHEEAIVMTREAIRSYSESTRARFVFPKDWSPPEQLISEVVERADQGIPFPYPYESLLVHVHFPRGAVCGRPRPDHGWTEECQALVFIDVTDPVTNDAYVRLFLKTTIIPGESMTAEPPPMREYTVCVGAMAILGDGTMKFRAADNDHISQNLKETSKWLAGKIVHTVYGAMWSLTARGVKTETVPPISKLDKNNRPGVPNRQPYTRITINEPRAEYLNDDPHGTHASPRPHWRRGHLRKLPDRQVYVRPCLVGSENEDFSDVGLKMYKCDLARLGGTT